MLKPRKSCGFNLRKFCTNSTTLQQKIDAFENELNVVSVVEKFMIH